MANTKKDRMALRQAWLARPENKRLWLVFANALLEDNDEEQWIADPASTIPILLDHMVEQDSVGILFLRRPPVVVRFEEWTRTGMQRTPNAIVRFLEREVWRKNQRELRDVVFKSHNPRYIEDVGVAISHLLKGRELLSCHYGAADSEVDMYNGVSGVDIENEDTSIADMIEWGPYALLK
jgi:hypothetical protein